MALINRISRLVKADFHAVLDHIEEPEQLLKQAIRDMDEELAAAEQRIDRATKQQGLLAARNDELGADVAALEEQLDLCFAAGEDALARKLIRRKLQATRLRQRLDAEIAANANQLEEQRSLLAENRSTLASLQQKAELFAQQPGSGSGTSGPGEFSWAGRDMNVSDDEVEIAFLGEKNRRATS